MAFNPRGRRSVELPQHWIEPRLDPELRSAASEVFDSGRRTIVDCAHVRVERLDTRPVLFSKVFKEYEDWKGQKYDYRYWAERENYFLREFLKKRSEFTHVVQPRHLISENEAAKQVLTCDAGITIANWLRVQARYADTATLSHPFQRADVFLRLLRACLAALKQIHGHRIVHCDIKEDNICIPYAPYPFAGDGKGIRLDFDNLKLIDFAFSVADAIPLTQVLVINPDERVPYQSELLISALRADRRSGSPNAVQQLDGRVDLFSLGYMAEKICAAGLVCAPGPGVARALQDIRTLVHKLKAFDAAPDGAPLWHDDLIAETDRLLAETAASAGPLDFAVDGEWTAEEMAQGRGAGRKTPLTPVALAVPTPVAIPFEHRPQPSGGPSRRRIALFAGLALAVTAGAALLYRHAMEAVPPAPSHAQAETREAPAAAPAPAPAAPVADVATEYAGTLASAEPREVRARALGRLMSLANAGDNHAAQHVAEFEKQYDAVKQSVAKSAWWSRGEGSPPSQAARWLENGALLAEAGDRPAMLDLAYAAGQGRGLAQDRVTSVVTYLKVIARSDGGDAASAVIRQSALRGLAAMLNVIVEQRDREAARRLLPALQPRAESGAADVQYFLGLFNECVARPPDLNAARQWYRKAAADPDWKRVAEGKARVLGRWCPRGGERM